MFNFPPISFPTKPGEFKVSEDYAKLFCSTWEEKQGKSSSATDPIRLTGGSSSSRTSGVVNPPGKSISAQEIKDALVSQTSSTSVRRAGQECDALRTAHDELLGKMAQKRNEISQAQAKADAAYANELVSKDEVKQETQSEQTEVTQVQQKESDRLQAEVDKLQAEYDKLNEQSKTLARAIQGYETLTQNPVSGIKGDNAENLQQVYEDAYNAVNFSTGDITDVRLPNSLGYMRLVSNAAHEFITEKIDNLSGAYDSEVTKTHSERIAAEEGPGKRTQTAGHTENQEALQRQIARAERSGDVDALITAQERVLADLKAQDKENTEDAKKEKQEIKDKINILFYITHPEGIVVADKTSVKNHITQKEFIELLNKYPDGFTLKYDGQEIKVSADDIKQALTSTERLQKTGDIAANSLTAISGVGDGTGVQKGPGANTERDQAIYNNLQKLSDEEFLMLVARGNDDPEIRNHNPYAGGVTDQTLVEALFTYNDSDLSQMYIVGRLADIAVKKGADSSKFDQTVQEALLAYRKNDTQRLANLQDKLDTANVNDYNYSYERNGLQAILYGTSSRGEPAEFGSGDIYSNGLLSAALTGEVQKAHGKEMPKSIGTYLNEQRKKAMPKITIPDNYTYQQSTYDKIYSQNMQAPNTELASQTRQAEIKLTAFKLIKEKNGDCYAALIDAAVYDGYTPEERQVLMDTIKEIKNKKQPEAQPFGAATAK